MADSSSKTEIKLPEIEPEDVPKHIDQHGLTGIEELFKGKLKE